MRISTASTASRPVSYTHLMCYLTITQEARKSRLFSFDNKKWRDFLVKIRKVQDQLRDRGVQARFLNKSEASDYVDVYKRQVRISVIDYALRQGKGYGLVIIDGIRDIMLDINSKMCIRDRVLPICVPCLQAWS